MWVPVRDAAAALGVSEDTVRRRMKAGTLPRQQEPTTSGFRWLVDVPVVPPHAAPAAPATASDAAPADADHTGEMAALRELVEVLRAELDHRNQEIEARAREVQELHILLRRAQGQPPQIAEAAPAMRPRTPPRPLWRRLLTALTG